MEYRMLNRGQNIGIIGLGAASLYESDTDEIEMTVHEAVDAGVNLIDTAMFDTKASGAIRRAIEGRRKEVLLQIHLGVWYPHGHYEKTRDLVQAKRGFFDELEKYGTDCADIGIIHSVEDDADCDGVIDGGLLDYAASLRQAGIVKQLGVSSHSAGCCLRFLATGQIDMVMLDVNPLCDLLPTQEGAGGEASSFSPSEMRADLFERCAHEEVAVIAMKPFGGGRLLDARMSPLGTALMQAQCLQYALDRPGVVSCLVDIRNHTDLEQVLGYFETDPDVRRYPEPAQLRPVSGAAPCIYCNLCAPCPEGIDIGLAAKLGDLAAAGDTLCTDRYRRLETHASDCTACGECTPRCPYGVDVVGLMRSIAERFGE